MKKLSKNIGLFGSSFNPPHLGHLAVLRDLSKSDKFDEIWLIPVYNHPFEKSLAPYDTRLKLTQFLWMELHSDKIKISTIEKDMAREASYTYDVIQELKAQNPEDKFTLILGTDAKGDLNKWHRYKDLKKEVDFFFIPRQGLEDSPYPEVSSTEIREGLKAGKSIEGLTTGRIARYLVENKIYSLKKVNVT